MTTDRTLEGVLYTAIRQYLHNYGSAPVFGYDIATVDAYVQTLHRQIEALEALRPHWAQGHTTDSVVAQVATGATLQLWDMLGVTNQTDAVVELRALQNERDRHVPDRDGVAFTTTNGVCIGVGEAITD